MNKTCLKCEEIKSATQFRRKKCNPDGLNHYCRECDSTYVKRELEILGIKNCKKCRQGVPRVDFTFDKYGILKSTCNPCKRVKYKVCKRCNASKPTSSFGRASKTVCMDCYASESGSHNAIQQRVWRATNKERHLKTAREYRKRPDVLEKRRSYECSHRGKESARKSGTKRSSELADGYVLKSLMYNTGIPTKELKEMAGVNEIIEVKRQLLKVRRAKTEVQKKQRQKG